VPRISSSRGHRMGENRFKQNLRFCLDGRGVAHFLWKNKSYGIRINKKDARLAEALQRRRQSSHICGLIWQRRYHSVIYGRGCFADHEALRYVTTYDMQIGLTPGLANPPMDLFLSRRQAFKSASFFKKKKRCTMRVLLFNSCISFSYPL
jgi:hypothetical protein